MEPVGAGLAGGAQTGPSAPDELADAASEAAGPLVDATGGDTPQVVMTPASVAATPPSLRIPWSPVFKSARKTLTTPGSVASMLEMALSDNELDILDKLRQRWQRVVRRRRRLVRTLADAAGAPVVSWAYIDAKLFQW